MTVEPRESRDTASMTALPYGPNTSIVRRFLQRLAGKPASDCAAAARVYLSLQGTPALIAADRAVGQELEGSGRTDARDAVVGPIIQLMSGHATRLASDPSLSGVSLDDMAEAALAAVLGLIVGDILAADALEVLYRPYAGIIPIEEIEGPQRV
jgi:hypothetical protein